jgi:hypothetical protein
MNVNETVRNQAWIGDAVLSLYVREWLSPCIGQTVPDRNALYELFTSNQFLSGFGEPTVVEAEIGQIYLEQGLPAAFVHIQARFGERFIRTARKLGLRISSLHTVTRRALNGISPAAIGRSK